MKFSLPLREFRRDFLRDRGEKGWKVYGERFSERRDFLIYL